MTPRHNSSSAAVAETDFDRYLRYAAYLLLLALLTIIAIEPAYADFFDDTAKDTDSILSGATKIIWVIAGFGILAIGVMSFFGKPKWDWMAYWLLGTLVIGGGSALIDFVKSL